MSSTQEIPSPQTMKQEVLLHIPDDRVHLADISKPLELAFGDPLEFPEDLLGENSQSTSSTPMKNDEIDWKEFAPKTEEYKSVVAKAIAGGTGHIIKGIFTCSNAYSKKVHKGGGKIMVAKEAEETSGETSQINGGGKNVTKKKNKLNTNLQRVEKLWKASEAIGVTVLEGGDMVSSSMIAPVIKSKLGKALLATPPGEVILASLDSFSKLHRI
ncbi:putative senescence/spartin-associated [Arabidopsis thaliana]|uniref:Senescence domain-containing protein n=1 Tax=Arabidopsis thaliana TaxID=3702 RepID=A0A178VMH8_ARATH|nr:hypothetical protein AXX17_AT3G23150 [Arabidopsis thaliana]